MKTVRDAAYDLLREFGLTTIFGSVGSAGETSSKTFRPTSVRSRASRARAAS